MHAHSHRDYNRPCNWPWARSQFVQQLASAQLAAQGTPAPVAPLQVLVLQTPSQTRRHSLQSPLGCGLGPSTAAGPQSLLLLRAQIYTLTGVPARPQSLQHLAWTDSSSTDAHFFLHFKATSKSLLLLPSPGFIVFSHHTPHRPHHLIPPRGPL